MDSWPVDYRTAVAPLGRGKERTEKPNYLDIKLGSLNAVNLYEKEHRLEWTSVLKHTVFSHFNAPRYGCNLAVNSFQKVASVVVTLLPSSLQHALRVFAYHKQPYCNVQSKE